MTKDEVKDLTGMASGQHNRVALATAAFVAFVLGFGWIVGPLGSEEAFAEKKPWTEPFLGPEEAGRLLAQLSAATDAQGVCYGWVIDSGRPYDIKPVTPSYPGTFSPQPPPPGPAGAGGTQGAPPGASPSPEPVSTGTMGPEEEQRERTGQKPTELDGKGVEYASNLGVGIDPRQRPDLCANWVVLDVRYTFSTYSEEITDGSFDIESSFEGLSKDHYEQALGQTYYDGLEDSRGAARLRDAIGGLPLLVADAGLAPPIPSPADPVVQRAANDEISRSTLTTRDFFSVVGALLIGLAVVVAVVTVTRNPRGGSS